MVHQEVTYLTVSDFHLGRRLPTIEQLTNNIRYYLTDNSKILKDIDILYIVGDVFDKLLNTNSKEYIEAMKVLTYIVRYCSKFNIKLRILNGTAIHDWGQVKALYTVISNLDIDIDFKYIDTLYIEHFEEYNLYTLYIPDNLNIDATDTYREVKELMKLHNLTKVDNVMVHGQFHFQLPMFSKTSHTELDYLKITNYFIHTGHIHTSKIYQRIIGIGSLDRLSHGEEEKKGGYIVKLYPDSEPTYTFLENKRAIIFKTIKVEETEVKRLYKRLNTLVNRLPKGSNVRLILTPKNAFIKDIEKEIQKRYEHVNLRVEKYVEKSKEYKIEELPVDKEEMLVITKKNIKELLLEEIGEVESEVYREAIRELEDVM